MRIFPEVFKQNPLIYYKLILATTFIRSDSVQKTWSIFVVVVFELRGFMIEYQICLKTSKFKEEAQESSKEEDQLY